jgi:hypothetical protein
VALPAAYQNIQLNMFSAGSISNNVLMVKHTEMFRKIFPNAQFNEGFNFFFGNTDSTFVVNPNGERIETSSNNPISDAMNLLIIRSNNYSNTIYNAPAEGQTVTMSGILSFDISNLIHIYAGADNIPYTQDDVIVYAPKFWERIKARLEVN